jgi:hypothetical protein
MYSTNLTNTTSLTFMPELAYPCYPLNPWFFSDLEKMVASLVPKD